MTLRFLGTGPYVIKNFGGALSLFSRANKLEPFS
jgi:hypothetical protein